MSAQAGIWNFDGRQVDRAFLEKLSSAIEQYGPDKGDTYIDGSIGMVYRAFHTTLESDLEHQPHLSPQGLVITWDGRLDNREDLILQLYEDLISPRSETDVAIVMAAFERWGTNSFSKLIGDWALSIWDPREHALMLVRDYVGVRHLYYYPACDRILWSTTLAALVTLPGVTSTLNNEYIAGYLASYPEADVTPYREIRAVPPGKFVRIQDDKITICQYWTFDPKRSIRYKTDAEYEEHFRHVFRQAVLRRLRSKSPVLAELSGGMDSSSIVCVADDLIAEGRSETPRLDTISYYDDLEPNWNERPYFGKVEERRGRVGFHLDVSKEEFFSEPIDDSYFSSLPGATKSELEFERKRIVYMKANEIRVLLSGIGGDEALGGVPNPIPELADLLVQGQLVCLTRKMKAWSLVKRRPWIHILFETLGDFLPPLVAQWFKKKRIAPWLRANFVTSQLALFRNREPGTRLIGLPPSYQTHINTLIHLQKQLSCHVPSLVGCYDRSYPYLDRDLWQFAYSIPREQILRPGQRRSLMRRALVGIVPQEILNRRRKAYVSRGPLAHIGSDWPKLQGLCGRMVSNSLGYVDSSRFLEALQRAKHGHADDLLQLIKTLKLELWLQGLWGRGILPRATATSEIPGNSLQETRAEAIGP